MASSSVLIGIASASVCVLLVTHVRLLRRRLRELEPLVEGLARVQDQITLLASMAPSVEPSAAPDRHSRTARTATLMPRVSHRPVDPPIGRGLGSSVSAPLGGGSQPRVSESESLFNMLPQETLLRVIDSLPPAAQLQCERVCHEWRTAVAALPLWPAWRSRRGVITELQLEVPGVMACPFGAAPANVPERLAAVAEQATAQVTSLAAGRMQLAMCGSQWTVFAMRDPGAPPAVLKQHSCRDLMLACGSHSEIVCSGDRDAQLRVWCARSGEMLCRTTTASSISALEVVAGDRLLTGDSQGALALLHLGPLIKQAQRRGGGAGGAGCGGGDEDGAEGGGVGRGTGELLDAISWRAHDGKVSALAARWFGDTFVSSGVDGVVRVWSLAGLSAQAQSVRASGVARVGARGLELGLRAVGAAEIVAIHQDTVTHLAMDEESVVSGSRDGCVKVTSLGAMDVLLEVQDCCNINCLAVHRGKMIVCGDDGQQVRVPPAPGRILRLSCSGSPPAAVPSWTLKEVVMFLRV